MAGDLRHVCSIVGVNLDDPSKSLRGKQVFWLDLKSIETSEHFLHNGQIRVSAIREDIEPFADNSAPSVLQEEVLDRDPSQFLADMVEENQLFESRSSLLICLIVSFDGILHLSDETLCSLLQLFLRHLELLSLLLSICVRLVCRLRLWHLAAVFLLDSMRHRVLAMSLLITFLVSGLIALILDLLFDLSHASLEFLDRHLVTITIQVAVNVNVQVIFGLVEIRLLFNFTRINYFRLNLLLFNLLLSFVRSFRLLFVIDFSFVQLLTP